MPQVSRNNFDVCVLVGVEIFYFVECSDCSGSVGRALDWGQKGC